MTTKFSMTRDINGYNGFGLEFSDTNYSATLTVGAAQSLVVPGISTTTTYLAVFSYEPGTSIWVANNDTAAVPVAASFGATTSELNPAARKVKFGDTLSFITNDTTAEVGVSFYGLT